MSFKPFAVVLDRTRKSDSFPMMVDGEVVVIQRGEPFMVSTVEQAECVIDWIGGGLSIMHTEAPGQPDVKATQEYLLARATAQRDAGARLKPWQKIALESPEYQPPAPEPPPQTPVGGPVRGTEPVEASEAAVVPDPETEEAEA